MHLIGLISPILLIVGGLNWGLVGILHMDLVQILFGNFLLLGFPVTNIVYSLIGLSAVHHIMQGKLFSATCA